MRTFSLHDMYGVEYGTSLQHYRNILIKASIYLMITNTMPIHFALAVEGKHIPYASKKERLSLWYTDEDREHFARLLVQDAVRCSALMAAGEVCLQNMTSFDDHDISCAGLDHLISSNVQKRWQAVEDARARHVKVVLEAQNLLKSLSDEIQYDLFRVSQASSRAARMRAHIVASVLAK